MNKRQKRKKSKQRCAVSNKITSNREVVLLDYAVDYVKKQGYKVEKALYIIGVMLIIMLSLNRVDAQFEIQNENYPILLPETPNNVIQNITNVSDDFYIRLDGSSTTTNLIPFQEGLSIGSGLNSGLIYSDGKNITLDIDGTTNPDYTNFKFQDDIIVEGSNNGFGVKQAINNFDGGDIRGFKARGTINSPLAVDIGDELFELYGFGYDGLSWDNKGGAIRFVVNGSVSTGIVPSSIDLLTTSLAGGSPRLRAYIEPNGDFYVLEDLHARNNLLVDGQINSTLDICIDGGNCLSYGFNNTNLAYINNSQTFSDTQTFGSGISITGNEKISFGNSENTLFYWDEGTDYFRVEDEVGTDLIKWQIGGYPIFNTGLRIDDNSNIMLGNDEDIKLSFNETDFSLNRNTEDSLFYSDIPLRFNSDNYSLIGDKPTLISLSDYTNLFAYSSVDSGAAIGLTAGAEFSSSHNNAGSIIAGLNAVGGVSNGNNENYTNSLGLSSGGYLFFHGGTGDIDVANSIYGRIQITSTGGINEGNVFSTTETTVGTEGVIDEYNAFHYKDPITGNINTSIALHIDDMDLADDNYALVIEGLNNYISFGYPLNNDTLIYSSSLGNIEINATDEIKVNQNILFDKNITALNLPNKTATSTSMYICWDIDGIIFLNETGCRI